ncbi:MAG: 16S rRNA (cytosine(967)-C(5))-methyltransferase RsmB [Acidobacteria bacterium]|nr:16S rRNA (cytosine(967)-C(5))-methyltransferase RsmB [Acidobacteriota bacterium]
MISPARLAAYRTLRAVGDPHVDLATTIELHRRRLADERDRALAAEIALGTLRWRAALDHVIAWAGHRLIGAFDPDVLDLLRLSAYQLLHLDRVPASAVVHDAVDLCRHEGKTSASGAVNAILRHISRDRGQFPMPTERDQLDYLAIAMSHPRWLAARWLDRLGFDTAVQWVRFNNQQAPLMLRANRIKTSRDDLARELAALGVTTAPARYAADGLAVTGGNPLTTPVASSGRFVVQDESSQLVAAYAGVCAGEMVLDACAAPGGKTSQMAADLGHGAGRLVAADVRPRRIRLLAQALRATGANAVHVVGADLLAAAPFGPIFDCVLVDAPCSGLATLRRDPDVKWRRVESDLASNASRQGRMLESAAAVVRAGGRLVYSTCSTEPEENEEVITAFLEARPDFHLESPRDSRAGVPPGVMACVDPSGCLRPTPHQHGLEPFFAARLRSRGRD